MSEPRFVTVKRLQRALKKMPKRSLVMVAANRTDEPTEARTIEYGHGMESDLKGRVAHRVVLIVSG